MGTVPSEADVLDAARRLIDRGVAVHWLHRRAKNPVGDNWQTAPVHTRETLAAAYQRGYNLGIRPGEHSKTAFGYLHLFDMDIRKPELAAEAWACLLAKWPQAKDAPFVISGSGGESRHVYFFSPTPLRSMNIGRSATFTEVHDAKKDRKVKKWDWSVDLYGAPKQAVLPPSVHPDTGENYVWGEEIDWDLLELGIGPILTTAQIESLGAREDDLSLDDDDDLMADLRASPMGLSVKEVDKTLADLPADWVEDHDLWVQAGMALHHEFEGSQVGFEKWCQWARQSEKFDIKDSKTRWKSFRGKNNPVRMASLIKAANDHRLEQAHADLDAAFEDDEDLDSLLGGVETGATANIQKQNQSLAVVPTELDEDLASLLGESDVITPCAPARSKLAYDPEWRTHFHRNEEGQLKSTLHNIWLIVRNDIRLRGVIALNRFTQEPVMIKAPARMKRDRDRPKPLIQLTGDLWKLRDPINGDAWTDSHEDAVRAMIEAPESQGGYGIKVSGRDLVAAINVVAQEAAFHPVKDYLESLVWDGVPRVETLFIDHVGATDDAYHREAALLWLIGAVTRIYEPGHKFDFVPILEGLQGKRKSTFFMTLARHWFAELEGDFHDKKTMVEQMQGAWIIEMPELQGFSRAEVTTIKGFISRQVDKVRLAYARRALPFPRQCIFGGTTNEEEYLRDASGGRRFWPIDCKVDEINITALSAVVDQIWAEALIKYRQWRERYPSAQLPLYMKNESSSLIAREMQESRRQIGADEVLAGQIEDWLETPVGAEYGLDDENDPATYRTRTCLLEIWVHMMGKEKSAYSERDGQMLGRAMRKVKGWRVSGARHRFPGGIGQQRSYQKVFNKN